MPPVRSRSSGRAAQRGATPEELRSELQVQWRLDFEVTFSSACVAYAWAHEARDFARAMEDRLEHCGTPGSKQSRETRLLATEAAAALCLSRRPEQMTHFVLH
eukprot:tig00001098_g7060.t1